MRLAAFLLAGFALLIASGCEKSTPQQKKMAKVVLLPDTPPPPPPPPPKELPPPPKDAPREVKLDQPKQEAPPQQAVEQLKMDGPAGDAPSAFAAGEVKAEYTGQTLGERPTLGGGGTGRVEFDLYRTRLQRLLQEELAKMNALKGIEYRLPVQVRRGSDGNWLVRLSDSSGDPQVDALLRDALARAIQREAPPSSAPERGFDVRVTNKMIN